VNKKTISDKIAENPYFFVVYILFLIAGCIILLNINKGDMVIYFNSWRGSFTDEIFKISSWIGEGLLFALVLLILGFFQLKYLVTGVSVFLGSGAVTQLLKNMFKEPRPKIFFENTDLVTYVQDFTLNSWNSFPSGHTTSGIAIFLFLALITKNKKIGALYMIAAIFVAISRVYLVQHFFIDVYFGSLVGTFFTLWIFNLYENSEKVNSSKWYNYSLKSKIMK
jgi:membrane-associated phospholipid phosphatase